MTWARHVEEAEGEEGFQQIEVLVLLSTFGKPGQVWKLGQSIAQKVELVFGDAAEWYTVDRQPLKDEEPEEKKPEEDYFYYPGTPTVDAEQRNWDKLKADLAAARAQVAALQQNRELED